MTLGMQHLFILLSLIMLMYVIKSVPEDFIVEEIPSVEIKQSGNYVYFWLQKRNITTLDAVQSIADFLDVPLNQIGFAGQKDKCAVTRQLCSVDVSCESRLGKFLHGKITVIVAGYGDEEIATGVLEGNIFRIIVRNASVPARKEWFINYFGEQRFSSDNIKIGRAVLQGKFEDAVGIILGRNGWQKKVLENYLSQHTGDYVGALKQLPKTLLRLVIHAYQSWLWNCAARTVATAPSDIELALRGLGFDESDDVRQIYEQLLSADDLTFDSFIIKALPSLSAEALARKVWTKVTDLNITPQTETVLLQFSLPKGSYATEVVRQLFDNCKN